MTGKVVVLTGGVGGAKLVHGLTLAMDPQDVVAVVNTGDDFRHVGLHVSPDIDTILYTLSGQASRAQGWGREGESWNFMEALRRLGGDDWFQLGDGDLALHVLRTLRLDRGDSLSEITQEFARAWKITASILPMSNQPVATILQTEAGELEFQDYFVRRRCEPEVKAMSFSGAAQARPAPGVLEAVAAARTIVIAPSNPYLSIDPILAVPGLSEAMRAAGAPVVAVSPIIGGAAVKGPTAKLMAELGVRVDNTTIADHFEGLIDGLLIDAGDDVPERDLVVAQADILMSDDGGRERVARAALDLAHRIATG